MKKGRTKNKRFIMTVMAATVVLALVMAVNTTFAPEANADSWITRQLTDNATEDQHPSLYDGEVAWGGHDGSDYEIYYYSGGVTTQLTDNATNCYMPSLYDGEIAWWGEGIDYWNGNTTTKISDSGCWPSLYNGQIAWYSSDGYDDEIHLYSGGVTTQLTDNTLTDYDPSLYNGEIAWCTHDGSDWEIFHYSGGVTTQLTDNATKDSCPSLYNGAIAWHGYDGNDNEIYYYSGGITTQLTDNATDDYRPSLYNGEVAWYGNDDGDDEIYYYSGGVTTQITNNTVIDYNPSLYNGEIAWYGKGGSGAVTTDYEIFYARLASAWISDALDSLLLERTPDDAYLLADIYDSEGSGLTLSGVSWSYVPGDLPGDTDGLVYNIGDSWDVDGTYYIKLGNGLAGAPLGSAVPEMPVGAVPFVGVFLRIGLRRLKRFFK